jgi:molybdenum cofactor biosynthesis enzyme MoaA
MQDPFRSNHTNRPTEVLINCEDNLESFLQGDPFPIKLLRVSFDGSCQLSCPSCRKSPSKFCADPRKEEIAQEIVDKFNAGEIEGLDISGAGEPFVGKIHNKILQGLVGKENSKVTLFTNGLLWTRERWESMSNMHPITKEARISVDAGTAKTYEQIRKGGKWDVLMQNLEYISTLPIDVRLVMVVQQANYRELSLLLEIAEKHGFLVNLARIRRWGHMTEEEWKSKAVWRPEHPEYQEFRNLVESEKELMNLINFKL